MNRREVICGITGAAAAAAPITLAADQVSDWTAWWERSKKYTMAIAEAMPAGDYAFAPFGSGGAEAIGGGEGARTLGALMQHMGQAGGFFLGLLGKGGAAPTPPAADTSKDATVR